VIAIHFENVVHRGARKPISLGKKQGVKAIDRMGVSSNPCSGANLSGRCKLLEPAAQLLQIILRKVVSVGHDPCNLAGISNVI
jgi:hypothetical protein